ncbi:hypothetical protein N7471_009231 [Penicillium samsonianum]|uniref:uncharacterized protein n=1 Tax=Penicillium samsonianum TaxID=1882272 RepID=UPI0025472D1B|nr:uncharacterized protein N7471_009231 [Penicillium samsonianum]KAJ6128014.1 hypothetical protein N7471_009231 [Penicillium samsonianum]
MFCLWAVSALLALKVTAALTAGSSLSCKESMQHNTISLFSHAPLTFSYEVPNNLACAAKCDGISGCRAWLYSSSGQECQLYREEPVFQAHNPHFISGLCDGVSISSSKAAVSSLISASSSQPSIYQQQPEPSVHAKRDWSGRRSHYHGHRNSHEHHV